MRKKQRKIAKVKTRKPKLKTTQELSSGTTAQPDQDLPSATTVRPNQDLTSATIIQPEHDFSSTTTVQPNQDLSSAGPSHCDQGEEDDPEKLKKEIADLENQIKAASFNNMVLKAKVRVSKCPKFKDLLNRRVEEEEVIPAPKLPVVNQDLKLKEECFKFCGMTVLKSNSSEQVIQFNSWYRGTLYEPYALQLLRRNEGLKVGKYHLPYSVRLRELERKLLKKDDATAFLQEVQLQVENFVNKREQLKDLKKLEPLEGITSIFNTHDFSSITFAMQLVDQKNNNSVLRPFVSLLYKPDYALPDEVTIDLQGCSQEVKEELMDQCNLFKIYPLPVAFETTFMKSDQDDDETEMDV